MSAIAVVERSRNDRAVLFARSASDARKVSGAERRTDLGNGWSVQKFKDQEMTKKQDLLSLITRNLKYVSIL